MKTIIIGLGNPILGDDGVGWKVVEEIRQHLPEGSRVDVECLSVGGLSLMEHLIGYDRAILVDSFIADAEDVGSILIRKLNELPNYSAFHITSAHDTSLQNAIQLGREMGAKLPEEVLVIGVAAALAAGVGDVLVLCLALIVNGFSRFVTSGLSAALPDVVPREQVVTMNSVATATGAAAAFLGANFMLAPRRIFGAGDTGAGTVIVIVAFPVAIALLLSLRFAPRVLGPTRSGGHGSALHTVATGWAAGTRVVRATPSVAATLAGLSAHRMVFGINTLLVLLLARSGIAEGSAGPRTGSGLGTIVVFVAATGGGAFLATLLTPAAIRRWGRYASVNAALLCAAVIQSAGAAAYITVMAPLLIVGCGFLLGVVGQVIKLCADSAMQIDVDDNMRGHVFAIQDSLFWISFIASTGAAAMVIPVDGRSPMLAVIAAVLYLAGFATHARTGRLRTPTN